MIWADGAYTSSKGYSGVNYHGGSNHSKPSGWEMTVNSDGTVTSTGDNGSDIVIPDDPVTTFLILELPNGSTLEAGYSDNTVTYVASVLPSTWMGIGYGDSMIDTDEVIWAAGADVGTSTVYDVYSTEDHRPPEDPTNLYTTGTPVLTDGFIVFTSTRPLDSPSDDANSFTITLGTANDMIWAYSPNNSSEGYAGVAFHGNYYSLPGWSMTVESDGTVTSSGNNGINPEPTQLLSVANGSNLSAAYIPPSSD
jgi:hypothetical protein